MLSNLEGRNDEKADIAASYLWWDFERELWGCGWRRNRDWFVDS